MQQTPILSVRAAHWRNARRLRQGEVAPLTRSWLEDPTSLTDRLRRRCAGVLRVELLRHERDRAELSEIRSLGISNGVWVLVREVLLRCDGRPWVFARSVMPPQTLAGRGQRLARLGTRPLGAFLFADPQLRRGELEVARLGPGCALFERAAIQLATRPESIWGRRSIFCWQQRPLLVNELFLPDLLGAG